MFNTSGSSGSLRGSRPTVKFGQVVCLKCKQPCEFDETAMHKLFASPDANGNHPGYVYLRAYCHGEHADIRVSFDDLRRNEGVKLEVFGDQEMQIMAPEPLKLHEKSSS